MMDRGGKGVGREEKAAVARNRQHRNVGARMLRAERGGVAPTEVVLIAGRKEGPRPIDRKQEPGGKTDLGDLVDEDAFLGKLRANRVEKGDLRRKLFESSAHLGFPRLRFRSARNHA